MHRYDLIRVFEYTQRPKPIPDTSTPFVAVQPSLKQAGGLENAAYTQWVAYADH